MADIGLNWWDAADDHKDPCPRCRARVAIMEREPRDGGGGRGYLTCRCRRCRHAWEEPVRDTSLIADPADYHRYANPWHDEARPHSGPAMFECPRAPILYRGALIYPRIIDRDNTGNIFDVVIDGVLRGQAGNEMGARSIIDRQLAS